MPALSGYKNIELLHSTPTKEIYHCKQESTGKDVVIRFSLGPFDEAELEHYQSEFEIIKSIEDAGVVKALSVEEAGGNPALLIEYFEGIHLNKQSFEKSEELENFLSIALRLTTIIGKVHDAQVIHKDIKPSNILLNPSTSELKLIDFNIASRLGTEQQEAVADGVLQGSLPYISPEQTGRMGRGIDYRSDFYSLGITFYELLAGKTPFTFEDPAEMIHAHIARQPGPLAELREDLPPVVSQIVMKLISKDPDKRYQSAEGLCADIDHCLSELKKTGEIQEFQLGAQDARGRFELPSKLYGREEELETLITSIEKSCIDPSEMLGIVRGQPGIGKSAFIEELYKRLSEKRMSVAKAKFEKQRRDVPYSAIIDAFSSLIRQYLAGEQSTLDRIRKKLTKGLGGIAGVVCELIPDLVFIIGEQPKVE
ncbi:MAG: protein kinase, partial [Deltaproteobacteria bacterium]|nr:protein kinase [Deltaproteobacteria bacterium]